MHKMWSEFFDRMSRFCDYIERKKLGGITGRNLGEIQLRTLGFDEQMPSYFGSALYCPR